MSHRYSLYTNGFYPFTDTEMVRFRNTFTKHVWDPTAGGFHTAVNGQDAPVYPPSYNGQFNVLRYNALAWMPLQHFDQASGAATGDQVYDIIMGFYESEVHGSPTDLTGGFHYLGLAEVVSAQWERECFSLTLFNRELVYDQDFAAKAVLTVDAFGEEGASFADPVIHVPRFTVHEGIRSQFRAGGAVAWEPGFEAVYGSVVEAVIDPLGCEMAYKALASGDMTTTYAGGEQRDGARAVPADDASAAGERKGLERKATMTLMPNPAAHEVTVRLTLPSEQRVRIELRDALGRRISGKDVGMLPEGVHDLLLPLEGHSPGPYSCTVHLDGGPLTRMLIVE